MRVSELERVIVMLLVLVTGLVAASTGDDHRRTPTTTAMLAEKRAILRCGLHGIECGVRLSVGHGCKLGA